MNALELRRRTLGKGVYKKTVEGNPAIAQGSLSRRNPGITMQGWTEQAQYEGKNLFDFKALTIPNGRTIIYNPIYLGDGTFTLSTDFKDSSGAFALYILPGNVQEGAGTPNGVDRSVSKTVVSSEGYVTVAYRLATDLSNPLESDIMLNSGSTALPYEPYTGGQPSPNPDYPQEIKNAGKYDEGTGRYQYTIKISDSEESPTKSQTVTLTSDRTLTKWDRLEKRNGQWGWVYKSAEIVLDGSENYVIYDRGAPGYPSILFSHNMTGKKMGQNNLYCEQLKYSNNIFNEKNLEYCYMGYNVNNGVYIGISTGENVTNVSEFKAWLSENPITFLYETAKETFVPLSESEQEQMNVLYTFRPTTVLSNDCECEMTLTYKTKKSLEVAT